jgi:hypothetical protein
LVKALQDAKPLVPIDYTSPDPIILAVDTSYIAVGYFLGLSGDLHFTFMAFQLPSSYPLSILV